MATEAGVTARIETELGILTAEVDDLPERARIRDSQTEDDWLVFPLEWDNLMGHLSGLGEAYRDCRMTAGQRDVYRELLRKLKAALPTIERLELRRPPVPLDP